MRSKFSIISFLAVAVIGLSAGLIQADFVQCVPLVDCDGANTFTTNNTDLINGTSEDDTILGRFGDDLIFGNEGDDLIAGDPDNDIIFGGPGADSLFGLDHDDILIPGPDRPGAGQYANGTLGNDSVLVFSGDVAECLAIFNSTGQDIVNLIGFGPYSAVSPFGQPGFGEGWIHVVDPIAGGDIFIHVLEGGNVGTEVINGLLSPNVTILPGAFPTPVTDCAATIPRGTSLP